MGIAQVTLQSLDGAHEWLVAHADNLGTNLTFHARAGVNGERLRVVGEARGEPIAPTAHAHVPVAPAAHANDPVHAPADAQTKFARLKATQPLTPAGDRGPMALGASDARATGAGSGETTTPRDVTEADIWKIRGQTLYFFNQLRGLQIIDIRTPMGLSFLASSPCRLSAKTCTFWTTRTRSCSRAKARVGTRAKSLR